MTTKFNQFFEIELKVRDYECDMGHVVNHAAYFNYLEHARHELLRSIGIKFGDLAKAGISLVVTSIEADFKSSLTSNDLFVVRTQMSRLGRIRLQFKQQIQRQPDRKVMFEALVTGTALNINGRPGIPPELDHLLQTQI